MTLGNVINARRALGLFTDSMDFATAYKIAKFIDSTESEQKFFDQHVKNILDKYRDGDNIPPEKVAEANEEIEKVASTEVDKPGIIFTADDFKGLKLTAAQVLPILKIME